MGVTEFGYEWSIRVYPNPAVDWVTVEFPGKCGIDRGIVRCNGRLIWQQIAASTVMWPFLSGTVQQVNMCSRFGWDVENYWSTHNLKVDKLREIGRQRPTFYFRIKSHQTKPPRRMNQLLRNAPAGPVWVFATAAAQEYVNRRGTRDRHCRSLTTYRMYIDMANADDFLSSV